jgi:Tfp pilus assembly protein PilX
LGKYIQWDTCYTVNSGLEGDEMYLIKIFSPTKFRNRLRGKAGSTLIWALIVVVIITLVLAAGFSIVQRQQNSAVSQHIENQAYYSAMSANRALLSWLHNTGFEFADGELTSGDTAQGKLIDYILSKPKDTPIKIEANFFETGALNGESPRTFETVTIYATRTTKTVIENGSSVQADVITFSTTAEYLGDSATVSGSISNTVSEWEEGGDEEVDTWIKLEVNPAPDKSKESTIDTLGSGNIRNNSTTNALLVPKGITASTFSQTNNIKRIYVEGTLELSNNIRVDEIVIEPGGVVHFASNSLSINQGVAAGTLYIKPGGTVTIASNIGGSIAPNMVAVIYAWLPANASDFGPDDNIPVSSINMPTVSPPAFQLGTANNSINFNSVIIQPFIPNPPLKTDENGDELVPPQYEFLPSYSPDIGNIGKLIPQGANAAIHLPEGYMGFNAQTEANRQAAMTYLQNNNILTFVCNKNSPILDWQRVAPFCPHFLAPNEPPPPTHMTSSKWTIDGYYGG